MGRLLVVLVLLALLALAAYAVLRAVERTGQARRVRASAARGWVVETRKDEQLTVVQLERGGEEPYVIGSVSISAPHWEYAERLDALRLEAQDKADALNRRLPR